LDAGRFGRRERLATCFDSRNVAGQRSKEDRFEGRNLQKFSLAIGTGTRQQTFPSSNVEQELDQLTSPASGSPTFRYPA
jgi:hypothetical protein